MTGENGQKQILPGVQKKKREKQVNFPVFHGVQTEGILEENGKAEQQPVKQSEQKPEKKTSLLRKLDEKEERVCRA